VAVIALAAYPALALWFFAATGPAVGVSWLALSFFGIACDVMLYTLAAELFPTSHRSTAAGAWVAIRTLGGSLGLWCEGWLYAASGSHAAAISILALAGFACPLIVAFCIPETSRRPLEEIAPEP
jgi:MFS family permease